VGALASTGHYGDAIERAETIASEAAAIDSMPLVAEARLAVGLGLERQGNYERALEELTQAYLIAGGAGHDIASLKAATRLSFVTGYQLARPEEGLRWAAIAEMLVTRLGLGDEPAVAEWLTNLGSVHQAQGKYDEALKAQQRALEVAERVYSEGHPRLAAMWINLANAHYGRGDYDEAIEANEKALAIYEASLGPFHPDLAMALLNLGVARHSRGELEEAIASFERALEIQTAAFGERRRGPGRVSARARDPARDPGRGPPRSRGLLQQLGAGAGSTGRSRGRAHLVRTSARDPSRSTRPRSPSCCARIQQHGSDPSRPGGLRRRD